MNCEYGPNYSHLKESLEDWKHLTWRAKWASSVGIEVVAPLRLRPGEKVLDVGCGIAQTIGVLRRLGIKAYGVDFNLSSLENRIAWCPKGSVIVTDCLKLPFSNDFFDAVISKDLFEHQPTLGNAELLLKECERVLKKGKKMVHRVTTTEMQPWIDLDATHYLKRSDDWWEIFFKNFWWERVRTPFWSPFGKEGYFLLRKNG